MLLKQCVGHTNIDGRLVLARLANGVGRRERSPVERSVQRSITPAVDLCALENIKAMHARCGGGRGEDELLEEHDDI